MSLQDVGTVAVVTLTGLGAMTLGYFAWRGHQAWLRDQQELKRSAARAAGDQEERHENLAHMPKTALR